MSSSGVSSKLLFVHRNIRYDLIIDTTTITAMQGALLMKNQR